jgi:hypothetical protein
MHGSTGGRWKRGRSGRLRGFRAGVLRNATTMAWSGPSRPVTCYRASARPYIRPREAEANGRILAIGRQRRYPVVVGRVDPEVRALIRCHALGRLTVVGSGAGTQVVKGKRSAALKRPAGAFPPTAMSRPAAR